VRDRTGRYPLDKPRAGLWCDECLEKSSPIAWEALPDVIPATWLADRILTLKEPWGWLMVHGFKDMENRTWKTKAHGRTLFTSSAVLDLGEYQRARAICVPLNIRLPRPDDIKTGGIIGFADLAPQITDNRSVWFCGPCAWPMVNHFPLPFQRVKGGQGYRFVSPELKIKIR
jgi:hypothetical protein